ncbi:hypothetical protein HDV00_002814 [Rhizophlyctis rosea]|nr:hypothetical protein HDV00_002814 [Rhizophlyctis rosea]
MSASTNHKHHPTSEYKARVSALVEKATERPQCSDCVSNAQTIAQLQLENAELREMLDKALEVAVTQYGNDDGEGPARKKFKTSENGSSEREQESATQVELCRKFRVWAFQLRRSNCLDVCAYARHLTDRMDTDDPISHLGDGLDIFLGDPARVQSVRTLHFDLKYMWTCYTTLSIVKALILVDLNRLQHLSIEDSLRFEDEYFDEVDGTIADLVADAFIKAADRIAPTSHSDSAENQHRPRLQTFELVGKAISLSDDVLLFLRRCNASHSVTLPWSFASRTCLALTHMAIWATGQLYVPTPALNSYNP